MSRVAALVLAGLLVACSDAADDDSGGDGDGDGDGDADGDLSGECGNGVVDGDDECEGPAGCDEGDVCTADCTCAPFPERPATSQALIARALEDGTIDYQTSLLYRVWALFQAPELPEEYDGVGTTGEDTQLFFEIGAERASFSAEIERAIAPYLVRPDDPASIFSRTTVEIGGGQGDPPPVLCPVNERGQPDWRYHQTTNFVIWSCGGGVDGPDTYANARVVAGQDFEQAWTALIGAGAGKVPAPRDDDYPVGPLPWRRVDVYLLALGECRRRHDECEQIEGDDLAAAVPDLPCVSAGGVATSSGYLIAKASEVPAASGASPFRNTAAHELFHLAQFRMNLGATGNTCSDTDPSIPIGAASESWLTEASAEWASHFAFPDDEPSRRTLLFGSFQRGRDNARIGLQATGDGYDYDAFLYPAFVKEETGKPDTVMTLWSGSQFVTSAAGLDDRFDSLYPFVDHFRDFAVRNFNRRLAGNPIVPHSTYDRALPFDGELYRGLVVQPGYRFGPLRYTGTLPIRVAPLAVQIDHVEFLPELQWIKFDAGTAGGGHVSLDALVKVGDQWERRRLNSPVLELCRDNPEDEDAKEAYLIFSNFSHEPGGSISGAYDVEKGPACPGGWRGTMRIVNSFEEHWAYDDANGHNSLDVSILETQVWTIVDTRMEDEDEVIDARWHATMSSSRIEVTPNVGCPRTVTTIGSGDGEGDSTFTVLFQENLVQTIAPRSTAGPGSLQAHTEVVDCEGAAGYDQPPGELYEAFDLYGTNEFAFLQADPRDPTSFSGSTTILHSDDGQGRVMDITGSWSLHRTPINP